MPDPALRHAFRSVQKYITDTVLAHPEIDTMEMPGAMEVLGAFFESRVDGQPVNERRPTAAGWMPIATAPKHYVLVGRVGNPLVMVGFPFLEDEPHEEGWWNTDTGPFVPTHWMPLPEPPQ